MILNFDIYFIFRYLHEKFINACVLPYKRSIQRGMLEASTIAMSTCTEVLNFALIYTTAAFVISEGYVSPIIAFQVVSVVNAGIVMSFLPAASFVPEFIRARVSASLMFRMINEPTKIDQMSDKGLKVKLSFTFFSSYF